MKYPFPSSVLLQPPVVCNDSGLFVEFSASLTQMVTAPESSVTKEKDKNIFNQPSIPEGRGDTMLGENVTSMIYTGSALLEMLHKIMVLAYLPGNLLPGSLVHKGHAPLKKLKLLILILPWRDWEAQHFLTFWLDESR